MNPEELREKAERYRRMASSFSDRRVIKAFNELAAEYEAQADEMEQQRKPPG